MRLRSIPLPLLVLACGDGSTNPGRAVATVRVAPQSADLYVGQYYAFTATVFGEDGDSIPGASISWSSSDPARARVSPDGMVTAGQPGTAYIRAASGGVADSAAVTTSNAPVTSVVLSPGFDTMHVGETRTYRAVGVTVLGDTVRNRPATWTSSDSSRATASPAGVVTARDTGLVYIRAHIEGAVDSASLLARPAPVATLTLSPPSDTIGTGWGLQLSATLRSQAGLILTGRMVAWVSTSAAATVSSDGLVQGVTPGGALIIATSEGVADTTFVEVMQCPGTPASPWVSAINQFTIPIDRGQIWRPSSPLSEAGTFRTNTGFAAPNPTPVLYGGGLIYGTSANDVVIAYDVSGSMPSDIADGPVCEVPFTSFNGQHTYADVRPRAGIGPAGVEVRQETFASAFNAAHSGYVLFRYTFTNTGATALSQFRVGFATDWDLGWGTFSTDDVARWNGGLLVAEAAERDSLVYTPFLATVPIATTATTGNAAWLGGADPDRAGYFARLSGGIATGTVGPGDVRLISGVGPFLIPAGGRAVVYFAFVGGDNRATFNASLAAARATAAAIGF